MHTREIYTLISLGVALAITSISYAILTRHRKNKIKSKKKEAVKRTLARNMESFSLYLLSTSVDKKVTRTRLTISLALCLFSLHNSLRNSLDISRIVNTRGLDHSLTGRYSLPANALSKVFRCVMASSYYLYNYGIKTRFIARKTVSFMKTDFH